MMTLRVLLLSLLAGLCPAQEKPNILLVLIDDMGVMDTSVPFLADDEGKPKQHALNALYHTPSMERLAANGFRCSRFYANSVCSPTRVSIMTGQSSARHRTTQWIQPNAINGGKFDPVDWNWKGLNKKDVTLPRLLSKAGYRTIHCGKGHFGPHGSEGEDPRGIGFDINIAGGSMGQPGSYYGQDGYGHNKGRKTHAVPGLEAYRGTDTYLTEALTLELNKEITKAVEEKKPFFAYMAHYAVHAPFQSDPRFTDRYKDLKGDQSNLKTYASMIEGMDKSLGDLLDQLEKLGVAENTLVIFLGDNGSDAPAGSTHGVASSAPLRGKKGTHYEGGMRVPFIAAWAKPADVVIQKQFPIAQGMLQSKGLGTIHDLMPTILEVCGVPKPENHIIDGGSLWSWVAGKEAKQPQQFLMHFPHSHRSSYFTVYIHGDSKLVLHHGKPKEERFEYFNLGNDPYEAKNHASLGGKTVLALQSRMLEELKKAKAQPSKPFTSLEAMVED